VGVRLQPPKLSSDEPPSGQRKPQLEKVSEGVPRGAIQLLPGGEAIILLADHQTTGGYPVGAVVASVDMWHVAQLRPGDSIRFQSISLESAVDLLRKSRERLLRSAASPPARLEPGIEELLMRGFLEWSDEDDEEDG
jgi:allophanate hydrolase subunit 2